MRLKNNNILYRFILYLSLIKIIFYEHKPFHNTKHTNII